MTQEKGAVTPQETDSDMPVSVQESGGGVGRWWPAAGLGALSVSVPAWDLLKEVHYLHYLHLSLAPGQITGREHSPTLQQKIGLKIY